MLFNTLDFAIFLPIVFVLYWFVLNKNIRIQNILIVVASYVFYSFWDWRFLGLIIFSTASDYLLALWIDKQKEARHRKYLLWLSILVNIGFLGFFKYYNFFIDSFVSAFSILGREVNANSLNIILPVGISFYTFQTLSYTVDVYNRKLKATTDYIAFSAFVSFFPQLVAGPIERATNFLKQFHVKRVFDYALAVDGMRQILWGLVKKVLIADNCAIYVNQIFNNSADHSGSTLLLGLFLFTIQIYGDFSGYSDIAIGTARLFGFSLKQNFAFPFFSRDMAEFWRRWHISLSTWFRDYLTLAMRQKGKLTMWRKIRNTMVIFLVSGFWHGASWKFVVWGGVHGLLIIPIILLGKGSNNLGTVAHGRIWPNAKEVYQMGITFFLVSVSGVFFRANSVEHALSYLKGVFSASLLSRPELVPSTLIVAILVFFGIEWTAREKQHALEGFGLGWNRPFRHAFYYALFVLVVWLSFTAVPQDFIYFQF